MNDVHSGDPVPIRPDLLVHQEGVLAVIAVIGLSFSERSLLGALAPTTSLVTALVLGLAVGLALSGMLWLIRGAGPLKRLERWQRAMVAGWTTGDSVAVAIISGLAEEALLRAWLQPVIGLLPAAVLFAVLHLVPDRKLWAWPAFALASGLLLGGLFHIAGYPAAAAAHIVINLVAFVRLRQRPDER